MSMIQQPPRRFRGQATLVRSLYLPRPSQATAPPSATITTCALEDEAVERTFLTPKVRTQGYGKGNETKGGLNETMG